MWNPGTHFIKMLNLHSVTTKVRHMPTQRKRRKEELDNGHYGIFIHRFQNFANVKKKPIRTKMIDADIPLQFKQL